MQGLRAPTLFVVGDEDHTSGYENGVRRMFLEATGCPRYLLTFHQLGHNACPNPAPPEVKSPREYSHYNDPVWDQRKVNNVNQHFCTAFFHDRLRGEREYRRYLTVRKPVAKQCKWSVDRKSGKENDDHTYWPGFVENSAKGLVLEHIAVGEQGTEAPPLTVISSRARL
jgi:hypothetical protein